MHLVVLAAPDAIAGDGKHWAFIPPKRPDVPRVKESSWSRNPIDAFILARLEQQGQRHAPEADRATLLRRLSFDLTGLPPSPEEQRVVPRRQLGQRPTSAWSIGCWPALTMASAGASTGSTWLGSPRPTASSSTRPGPTPGVIATGWSRPSTATCPTTCSSACSSPATRSRPGDPWAFIATGFNRCYPDMVDLNDQRLRRQNALDDITETTGLVFLGLTIGCARCHDHKFDPIPQTDYYQPPGVLRRCPVPRRLSAGLLARGGKSTSTLERPGNARSPRCRSALIRLEAPLASEARPGAPPGLNDETPPRSRSPRPNDPPTRSSWSSTHSRPIGGSRPVLWTAALDPSTWSQRQDAARSPGSARCASRPPDLPKARGIDEAGPTAPPTYLLRRGDYTARGPEVAPAFPGGPRTRGRVVAPRLSAASVHSSGRRSALADWLVRPDHPLTARVIVNRLWQHHFGRGLVATASDFGAMGEEPSHPELLDWLATELVARGWSLKAMHRLIVTSATYRQSSDRRSTQALAADPDNLLFGRQNRRRLDGEAIRDALLSVSGSLNPAMKGPSVFPELPPELSKLSSKGAVWPVSPRLADRRRRSLYVFVRRNLRYPFFEVFDRPDTNASCPQRPVTTIAPQALSLLNSSLARDSARALAARAAELSADPQQQADRAAAQLALGRAPDPRERQMMAEFLARGGSMSDLCLALLNTNAFLYVD